MTMNVLEVNLISAQDLLPPRASKKPLETYVVAYLDPKKKVASRIDRTGGNNPTWNDKFLFVLDANRKQSWLVLEVYAVRKLKDQKIGTVNVLLEEYARKGGKTGCVSFYVRGTGGELQGIVNMGVEILGEEKIASRLCAGAAHQNCAYGSED